jgi:hypothetical protein
MMPLLPLRRLLLGPPIHRDIAEDKEEATAKASLPEKAASLSFGEAKLDINEE